MDATADRSEVDFLGAGNMAARIRVFDWTATPLGGIDLWPASLKTTVGVILRSPVPIVTLWGPQGTMIYNDAYSEFAGGRHPQLLGSAVREGWPEVADFNDNVMKVGLAGGVLSYQDQELTLYRSGAPEQVFMNLDYSPVIDEAGQPIGVIAIVVETTTRVSVEAALRDNEARLRFLDALARETAKSTDADAILAITTRMLGEHLGLAVCAYADMEPDEDHFTIRGDWSAAGSPSIVGYYSLADFGQRAVTSLRAGKPLIINNNLVEIAPKEAATFQAIGITATICMPLVKEGRLTALMAIHHKHPHAWTANELALLREVTERSWAHIERVRSEAEARAGEQRFREELERQVAERTAAFEQSEKSIRTVFETSHLYQGLLTTEGKLVYANATSLKGIEATLEDVAGLPFWDTPWFTGTAGMPELVRAAVGRVAAGGTESVTMELKLPVGVRSFEFSMRPVKNDLGEVVALVPEAVDTTARVRTEQALLQAQKMEAIGNLTGGIAHDFNNLLMAVLGSLELLGKKMPSDPALRMLLDNAMEGAKRGVSLTRRMLAFARRQELKSERIDVRLLVEDMTELLRRSLGPTIRLDMDVLRLNRNVDTDANQLEAALLNLAVNARDAMNGEGRIVISAREETIGEHERLKAGAYVCLSVSDTGEGMEEATLRRAMEPFFTTKGVGKGTGLGLSMVHGLAEQSGGALILHSDPGKGTTAEIWLPAFDVTESDTSAANPRVQPAPDEESVAGPTGLAILAVDDDALVLMNTAAMLQDLGHEVAEATSGRQALELLRERPFDLIITDHAMPHMTGAQLAAEIRAIRPDLPIILATGYAELPPGVDASLPRLSKPFWQAELAEALRNALHRRQPMPASGDPV